MEVIGWEYGGRETVHGRSVARIVFQVQTGEGAPEELVGYCSPPDLPAVLDGLHLLYFTGLPMAKDGADAAADAAGAPL